MSTTKGPGSFCVPRAAINALLTHGATAYDICAYLTLARFTDASGMYSTASLSAIHRYTGANKTRGGPVARALARLHTEITVPVAAQARGPRARRRVPVVLDRAAWERATGDILTPLTGAKADVRHVLPSFDEPLADRVWFGNNLVTGMRTVQAPLKSVKHAGDIAARFLLWAYAEQDMEAWGALNPLTTVYRDYHRADDYPIAGGWHGSRWKAAEVAATGALLTTPKRAGVLPYQDWEADAADGHPLFAAVAALESAGLLYEVVTVLNRNRPAKSTLPPDSEPYYTLDTRSLHGYTPRGEEGLAWLTARTAGELGKPVAGAGDDNPVQYSRVSEALDLPTHGGQFNSTYAAIVPAGQPHRVMGLYRLRFRVANTLNAGVSATWARLYALQDDALAMLTALRKAHGLPPVTPPHEHPDGRRKAA